jgi:LmbE family N-acetylglucosaminyl deacetylase
MTETGSDTTGQLDGIERVLVVAAHPDDIDFSSAGTVAVWTGAGVAVSYCIVTDGDAGGFDPAVPRAEIGAIRRAEQTAAAKRVGVDDVTFLGYPDGRLTVSLELRRDIARQIRRVRPDRVISPSPDRNYQRIAASHPDHMATGEATLCAVYPDARNPFAFPELVEEGHEAWVAREVWLSGVPAEADRFVDVTDTIDRKIAALREHASQMVNIADIDSLVRDWNAMNAELAGLPKGRYAEMYRCLPTA